MLNCSRSDFIDAINQGNGIIVLGTARYSWDILGKEMSNYLKTVLIKVKANVSYADKSIKCVVPIHTTEQVYGNVDVISMEKGIPTDFKGVAYNYKDKVALVVNDDCIDISIGGKHIKRCITATAYHKCENGYRTSYGMFGNCLIGDDYYSLFGEIIEVDETHYCSTAYYPKMTVFYAIKNKDKKPFIITNKCATMAVDDDEIPVLKKRVNPRGKNSRGTSLSKRSSRKQLDDEYEAGLYSYYDEPDIDYVEDDDEEYF